jgi:hypothetical protein
MSALESFVGELLTKRVDVRGLKSRLPDAKQVRRYDPEDVEKHTRGTTELFLQRFFTGAPDELKPYGAIVDEVGRTRRKAGIALEDIHPFALLKNDVVVKEISRLVPGKSSRMDILLHVPRVSAFLVTGGLIFPEIEALWRSNPQRLLEIAEDAFRQCEGIYLEEWTLFEEVADQAAQEVSVRLGWEGMTSRPRDDDATGDGDDEDRAVE